LNPAIILVDDERSVLAILERILPELAPDYELLSVANGAAALALLVQRSVALVITDQRMADMDGVVLTATIKAQAPHCSVILMTGYPTREIEQRALAAGAAHFLAKPFLIEQFATMVRAALRQERAVGSRSGPAM
jgi:two-component system, NtrC family, C4-dicarboxylate transport response regulator DctD